MTTTTQNSTKTEVPADYFDNVALIL